MKRRVTALGTTVLSLAALLGFAPTASASVPTCTTGQQVSVGGYGTWVPVSSTGSVDCVMGQQSGFNTGTYDLQVSLRRCNGANGLAEDGYYGPATAQAVRDFQARMGISVDGVYGPQTRRAMYWNANTYPQTICNKF
ncbi:peptidoglycan-binding domain-containing protein [Streptomyces racemochromogenes]|uniref:Peptidoglycan-binding domain-containing protein n=1 Tax=Streptomyces racemochromogenes TaxID=67353 RepID=A0ABW7PDL8_9ACTN